MSPLLVRDLAQLVSPAGSGAPLRGATLGKVQVVEDAYVLCEDGRISGVGRMHDLSPRLGELDEMVVGAGGRLYLAKDSRIPAGLMSAMYPRLDEFRRMRAQLDPDGVFGSDLSRRLGL